ncbi:MAG: SIS domain-containing protein [Candidatus Neomarinimicrobiota bacterium]|nr:SIS domain-containing protein [Candidatus Neomarinimicrobiota bacterium]
MNDKLDPKQIIISNNEVTNAMLTTCIDDILIASEILIETIKNGNKVLWCGNGGSAADSQHMSTELMGGLRDHDRPPIPSIALTTDSSFLTAWSNDTDFNTLFSRQIEAIGNSGDVLIAISTSGNSENIVEAVNMAEKMNMKIIILTGKNGGKLNGRGDIVINIPSNDTQRIQEGHLLTEHILCEMLESSL